MHLLLSAIVSILSFGAVPGNDTVNNAVAINQAISYCAGQGGGTVIVPPGVFTTGSIYLQSRVKLRIDEGATLKGSPRLADYQSLKTTIDLAKYESGRGTVNFNSATDPEWSKALVFAVGVSHVGIEGKGRIDGADVRNAKGEEGMRGPHTILLAGCDDVTFSGFAVENSANYAFLAYKLSNAKFKDINITGGWDGIHIRGGKGVTIDGCTMHTGDDAIAGGYWEQTKIRRCVLNSSCNGIRMIMPSTDVVVSDCDIYGPGQRQHITSGKTSSDAAINIEPGAWGEAPGRLDNIVIRRIKATHVLTPMSVTLGDDNSMGRIVVDRMVARDITRMAMSVKSWGTAITDRATITNCDLEFNGINDPDLPRWFEGRPTSEWPVFPCWGLYLRNVGKATVKRLRLSVKGGEYRRAITTKDVGEMITSGVTEVNETAR